MKPNPLARRCAGQVVRLSACIFLGVVFCGFVGPTIHSASIEPDGEELLRRQAVLFRIHPEERGGEAFKLIYLVPVPMDVFWRFKTDFQGDFLLGNKYILEHRLVEAFDNVAVTENIYTHLPGRVFRWRTTAHREENRLDFRLENPRECGQRFHYGTIRMEPFGSGTKITHIAYFDFFGARLWAILPLQGGMSSFLHYTARWEKETVAGLRDRYAADAEPADPPPSPGK